MFTLKYYLNFLLYLQVLFKAFQSKVFLLGLQTIKYQEVVMEKGWMLVCVYFKILFNFSIVFASTSQGISK